MSLNLPRVGEGPGLLIIEGDADTLRREGHTQLTDHVVEVVEPYVRLGLVRVHRRRIRSAGDLADAKSMANFSRYDAAMVLAHAGPHGVQVAPDLAISWSEVAAAIAPTKPRHLLAVACFAGLSSATDPLFDGIPTLDRIVGSPAPLTIKQARAAIAELILAAYGTRFPMDLSYLVSAMNASSTGGLLFTRTRTGRDTSTSGERALEDLLGLGFWALLQGERRDDDLRT